MVDFKKEIKVETRTIAEARLALDTNRILINDYSSVIGSLKTAIRTANRESRNSDVSKLTKELNLRRMVIRQVLEAQANNRRVLRNAYIVRSKLIKDWVAAEEA